MISNRVMYVHANTSLGGNYMANKNSQDNAQSYYSINVFKGLINSIYKKYSCTYISKL